MHFATFFLKLKFMPHHQQSDLRYNTNHGHLFLQQCGNKPDAP